MRKKSKISPDELKIFETAMQGTKPLTERKERLKKPKPKSRPNVVIIEDEYSFFDGSEPRELVQGDDSITYNQQGVDHKVLRNLSKGQYNVEAVLDLHRRTIEEARLAVNHFLHDCLKNAYKCVLIVHGKGKPGSAPALKNQINHWLRQAKPVLAFCSAAPRHGGQGAVYVLLKSKTEEKFV